MWLLVECIHIKRKSKFILKSKLSYLDPTTINMVIVCNPWHLNSFLYEFQFACIDIPKNYFIKKLRRIFFYKWSTSKLRSLIGHLLKIILSNLYLYIMINLQGSGGMLMLKKLREMQQIRVTHQRNQMHPQLMAYLVTCITAPKIVSLMFNNIFN